MRNRTNHNALRSIIFIVAFSVTLCIFTNCFVKETYAASTDNSELPSDSAQAAQMEALGLSSEQPDRVTASGKSVDKTKNPLGGATTVVNRTYQLAYTCNNNGADMLNVYNNPIGKSTVNMASSKFTGGNSIASGSSSMSAAFKAYHRYLVAADIDGNGTQEVANVGFVKSGSEYALQLYLSDYNTLRKSSGDTVPATSKLYTIATFKKYPNGALVSYDNEALKCAAGDFNHDGCDEIAIATEKSIYVCKVTMSTCKIVSSITDYTVYDIEALDGNGDGYPELMAIKLVGKATLLIYDSADITKPSFTIPLTLGSMYFTAATVDIGDIFGDGDRTLVIGGRIAKGNAAYPAISYIKYHPDTESYDTSLTKVYNLVLESNTTFKAVEGDLQIKCVNLTTKVEGTPEYVVLGGYIFQYSSEKSKFVRQTITSYKEHSEGVSENSAKKSEDNITDANYTHDDTYIFQTLVGNFDGNAEGKEQILLLHYNQWYDEEIIYVTQCFMNEDGEIVVNLTEKFRKTKGNSFNFPSICAVDVYNHDTKLTFLPSYSYFEYSNPVIVAVLGASPYYEELEDKTEALGNVSTTFGTGTEDESSSSQGVTASAGISYGFEQSLGVFGLQFVSMRFETEISSSFEASWGSSTLISKNVSYTNYYNEDAVVLTVIPYDVYIYNATSWNSKTQKYETGKIVMKVPCDMLTTIMTVEEYNKAAKTIKNAPVITSDVLNHTIGDPRTYPSTTAGLTNVKGKDVLMTGSNVGTSFIGCGVGNSSVEQSITSSQTESKSYDFELNVSVSSTVSAAGVSSGVSVGAGYTTNVTVSSTKSTTRTGSVSSVPSDCKQYQFYWAMVAYNYNLKAGSTTQEVPVINYICKPLNSVYPAKVPKALSVTAQNLNSNQLKWSAADGATGYYILRSFSEDGEYENIGTVYGKSTNSYTDTSNTDNKDCYYKVQAYNSVEAVASEPIKAEGIRVNGIQIQTQPKLNYKEFDLLDLSALVVNLMLSNQTTKQVAYSDFDKYCLITSLKSGLQLGADDTGMPINIKYTPLNISQNTNSLTVKKQSSYPIDITVKFTVGTADNASQLVAGSKLKAEIVMENTKSSTLQAVAVLALYDKNGTMVQDISQNVNIGANATAECSNSLTLPADISGYTAKVFIWDGTSLSTSTLTPLSDMVQITS